MKIVLNERGLAIVTAETLNESIRLQELCFEVPPPNKKMGRPVGSKNGRKIERKKDCPYCGKRVKRLRLHMLQKHPVEYKRMYGDTTTGGQSVQNLIENGGWSRSRKLVVN
jgi:hypothetical protein